MEGEEKEEAKDQEKVQSCLCCSPRCSPMPFCKQRQGPDEKRETMKQAVAPETREQTAARGLPTERGQP